MLTLSCGTELAIKSNPQADFELDSTALFVGRHSCVYRGHARQHERSSVAFKRFASQISSDDSFRREVSSLVAVGEHPNIVKFLGVFAMPWHNETGVSSLELVIGFDYCCGGDLLSVLSKHVLSERVSRDVASGVLRALDHVHRQGYVHRDVTPENVLLSSDGAAVLADFGSCSGLSDCFDPARKIGSPGYVAPEIWSGEMFTAKSDIFSTGVMLHFLLSGKLLFSSSKLSSIMRKTAQSNVVFTSSRLDHVSDACRSMVGAMVETDPTHRLAAAHALEHEWFSLSAISDDGIHSNSSTSRSTAELSPTDHSLEAPSYLSSEASLADLFAHPLCAESVDHPIFTSSRSASSSFFSPEGKKPFFVRRSICLRNACA
jgi:serine/threonine protein kinase